MDFLAAHNAAATEYSQALDAYVKVTTTTDVITKVVELARSGDIDGLNAWCSILEEKAVQLREVSGVLKEYYNAAYAMQFSMGPAPAVKTSISIAPKTPMMVGEAFRR